MMHCLFMVFDVNYSVIYAHSVSAVYCHC